MVYNLMKKILIAVVMVLMTGLVWADTTPTPTPDIHNILLKTALKGGAVKQPATNFSFSGLKSYSVFYSDSDNVNCMVLFFVVANFNAVLQYVSGHGTTYDLYEYTGTQYNGLQQSIEKIKNTYVYPTPTITVTVTK